MNCRNKILVIAPAWIGDVVMAQALLRLIKQQDPHGVIDVLALPLLHPLLRRMPEITNCLAAPFSHGKLQLFKRFRLAKTLHHHSYTHAYILPNSFKSALIPFWAKIPSRIGWCGESRYFLINDIRFTPQKLPLMVERYLALGYKKNAQLMRPFLFPQLQVVPENINLALKRLHLTLSGRPILALCPGAEYGPAKRWPPSYFAKVAQIKKNEGWEVWLFGSVKDQLLAQEIQAQCYGSCIDLTGKTDLGEVVDLMSVATVVVANDSGLMHIAAALGKTLVAIYGSTSPTHAPPLSANKYRTLFLNLPCSPCKQRECPLHHTKCLYDLSPDLVLQAITAIL